MLRPFNSSLHMSKHTLGIGIVGTRFMGRAHSNAYRNVPQFFDLPASPVLQMACGRNQENLANFAQQFGWQHTTTDYQQLATRDDIDLVDISTSNDTHLDIALAAAKAGKHIVCEKPLARTVAEAQQMYDAAQAAGVTTMMVFNYRFLPALALAKRMIAEGKLGTIRHFNAVYYQDWLVDETFPITWRHSVEQSGSGAHGDMNAHIIDLARHLVGEFAAVTGEQNVFVKERPVSGSDRTGSVTADDATTFLARFDNGAVGSFCATRMAAGRKNFLRLEIFGSQGSLNFNLERLNELEYYDANEPDAYRGFKNILVTEATHPYIDAWWPPGHTIGWEHTFIHLVARLLTAIGRGEGVTPNFYDGLQCQRVLDAVTTSARTGQWEPIDAGID